MAVHLVKGVAFAAEGVDGHAVEYGGIDVVEFHIESGVHALDFSMDEIGFGRGLALEPPEGGGHFLDEEVFDEVLRLEEKEVFVDDGLEVGEFFAREDEFGGVGAVFDGVGGRAAFAGQGQSGAAERRGAKG